MDSPKRCHNAEKPTVQLLHFLAQFEEASLILEFTQNIDDDDNNNKGGTSIIPVVYYTCSPFVGGWIRGGVSHNTGGYINNSAKNNGLKKKLARDVSHVTRGNE